MEMQFEQKLIRFLCRTAWGEKTVEETAEIKLPAQEVQPEQILGTWGQVCLTEKHWSDGAVAVSGGVNAPYIWLKAPDGMTSWELFDLLLSEVQVVGTPGSGFGPSGEGYFRLTAFGTRESAEEAVRRIAAL